MAGMQKTVAASRADSGICYCRAEQVVGTFWRWVAQPLLFGLIGTGLNFHKLRQARR